MPDKNKGLMKKQDEGQKTSLGIHEFLTWYAQKNNFKGTKPYYDFRLIQQKNLEDFKPALEHLKKQRTEKKLETTSLEIDLFQIMWHKAQIQECIKVEQASKSNSDRIEIFKYKSWMEHEIRRLEYKINTRDQDREVFNWNHDESKAVSIYDSLIEKEFISNTTLDTFKTVFGLQPETSSDKIVWTLHSRGKNPHKTALRDFLEIATGSTTITQRIVSDNFVDTQDRAIMITKPKVGEYSKYRQEFEALF